MSSAALLTASPAATAAGPSSCSPAARAAGPSPLRAGLALRLDAGIVTSARFAFGGLAAVVKRAAAAEAAVIGRPWNEANAERAAAALAQDFTPITDLRASAGYRQRAAANLLRRFGLETRAAAPLAAREVNVFARAGA